MLLLIQSLPLSLRTFWRYLILLPFLAIGAVILSLASNIPILGLVVPGTISAGLTIIGLRCALAARGHGNALDNRRLLFSSLVFCVILGGVGLVAKLLLVGIGWGLTYAGVTPDPRGLLVGVYGISFYWSSILLALLSPLALASALFAVPMTAAAYSATPNGLDRPVLFGFGAGTGSLMIILAIWLLGGNLFSLFGELTLVLGVLVTAILALANGEPLAWELSLDPWTVSGSLLFMTWASSWFFATAVLAWERCVDRDQAKRSARIEENRVPTEDFRALRKKRM